MKNYKQTIINASRELSAQEKVKIKHLQTVKFDDVITPGQGITIRPTMWAIIKVESEVNEYTIYLICDGDTGTWYSTGSVSFWDNFYDIWADMDGDDFQLEVFKMESNKYRGKHFLTCNIQ